MYLPLLTFIIVTLTVVSGAYLAGNYFYPDARKVRRRLAEEFSDDATRGPASPLFRGADQLSMDGRPPRAEARLPGPRDLWRSWRTAFEDALGQANLSWKLQHVFLACLGLGLGLGGLGYWLGKTLLGLVGLVLGALVPYFVVQHRRHRRQDLFLRQLPNAFELMARVIRAGQSVPQALQAVVDAFEDPLAREFAQCQVHLGLGLRPEITFREMAHRCGVFEMRIFVMALLIQQQTGGNLSDVLDRLAAMTRARLKLRNHVKTLTAEGRLQGWTLVVLPFVVFAAMMAVNRDYAETLLESSSLLAGSAAGLIAGIVWIRRIVHFDY